MYRLTPTEHFSRALVSFLRKHPNLVTRVDRVMDDLEVDPFMPRLGLHSLTGKHAGERAVRVTDKYRITLTFVVGDHEIELLNIGTHDEVYR